MLTLKNTTFTFVLSFLFFAFNISDAQTKNNFRSQRIKSFLIKNWQGKLTPIILPGKPISVSFDDLITTNERLYYKIRHCNSEWIEDPVVFNTFYDGNELNYFSQPEYSSGSLREYKKYNLQLPNAQVQFKIGGNYVFQLFNQNNELLAQERFMVSKEMLNLDAKIHRTIEVNKRNTHHEIKLKINHNIPEIRQFSTNLKIVVLQNNDWNRKVIPPTPVFRFNSAVEYTNGSIVFEAGNESRFFSTRYKELNGPTSVRSFRGEDGFETILMTSKDRSNEDYMFYEELNDGFEPHTADYENQLSADYSSVHFSLMSPNILGKDIYVYGKFNGYTTNESNLMSYDPTSSTYQKSIPLKQGYYNYNYVLKDKKTNQLEFFKLDGNHFNTNHDYTILVYYQYRGLRLEELLGSVTIGHIYN